MSPFGDIPMWHYKMNYCVMCLQQFETNINNASQKKSTYKTKSQYRAI